MNKLAIIFTLFISNSILANDQIQQYNYSETCDKSPYYKTDAIQALTSYGLKSNSKYQTAMEIKNSCQLEAFYCLAMFGIISNSNYRFTTQINSKCAARIFCNLAEVGLKSKNKYRYALKCED